MENAVDGRIPHRRAYTSRRECLEALKPFLHTSGCHISVYEFRKFKGNGKVDYKTAVVDKVFFDIDVRKKFGKNHDREYYDYDTSASVIKFRNWLADNNYVRRYYFTGGGYHIIVGSDYIHPFDLFNAASFIKEDAGVDIDKCCIGDFSQLRRLPGSINFSDGAKRRNNYVIPLKEEEVGLPLDELMKLAKRPRHEKISYGDEIFKWDRTSDTFKRRVKTNIEKDITLDYDNTDLDDLLLEYGWEIDDFCIAIKSILSSTHIGHWERYILIKYLKDVVLASYKDACLMMVYLCGADGKHSFKEKQAYYIYRDNKSFYPQELAKRGYCPAGCNYKCLSGLHDNCRF